MAFVLQDVHLGFYAPPPGPRIALVLGGVHLGFHRATVQRTGCSRQKRKAISPSGRSSTPAPASGPSKRHRCSPNAFSEGLWLMANDKTSSGVTWSEDGDGISLHEATVGSAMAAAGFKSRSKASLKRSLNIYGFHGRNNLYQNASFHQALSQPPALTRMAKSRTPQDSDDRAMQPIAVRSAEYASAPLPTTAPRSYLWKAAALHSASIAITSIALHNGRRWRTRVHSAR